MYIEAEVPPKLDILQLAKEYASNFNDMKREIAKAYVDKIDEKGQLLIKFDQSDVEYWTEFYSNQIHPCGFYNYICKENAEEASKFIVKTEQSI
jgi:hypothetical protein